MYLITSSPLVLYDCSFFIITGNETVDQILVVLLETNMFVGGVIGLVLDGTIPGTNF